MVKLPCYWCNWIRQHGYLKALSPDQPTVLFLRTDFDELTHWVSSFVGLSVENARRLGFNVLDLYGVNANAENFFSYVNTYNPDIIVLATHGLENTAYAQNGELLLSGCVNDQVLSNRLNFALACRTASKLGYSAVDKKAYAYFGWLDDFIVIMDDTYASNPLNDPYASSFLRPVLNGLDALFRNYLGGVDLQTLAKNVYETVIQSFNNEIAYWKTVPTPTASQMVTYLISDRDAFIPITATGVYTPPSMVTTETFLAPMLAIGLMALPLAFKK